MSDQLRDRSATGYAAWRLIAETLRSEIAAGRVQPGDRLPSEHALAERFGVNRHTVRRSLAVLASEDLVEARKGSGVFVTSKSVYVHRIGLRTRMGASLGSRVKSANSVLSSAVIAASTFVAEKLRVPEGHSVLHLDTINQVDDRPFAVSSRWFDAERFPDFTAHFTREGSVTRALKSLGVDDYVRSETTIGARHATTDEAADLQLDPGAIVLESEAIDSFVDGTPLQYLITRFAAQRVKLSVDPGA